MTDYTRRHLSAANVEEPAPQWPAPEPIRYRLPVKVVAAYMLQEFDYRKPHSDYALLLAARGGYVPRIIDPAEWYEFCVSHLGCSLSMGEFKQSEFWQTFVRVACRLLGEC